MSEQLQRPAEPPPRSERARWWLRCAVLLVACFAIYAPALDGDFVWDDDTHLLDNPVLEENGLYKVWLTPPQKINYWPVTFTTYWIEHQLWGLTPLGYHVVNVLIHAANALLIWLVLRRLKIPHAWLAAFVFAVHPVNVESVAWITQRKSLLSFFFFALSLLVYLRFDDRRRVGTYLLALFAFAAAVLSKGAAAPLPAVLLLCAWWRRRVIAARDVLLALPFFAVAALASLLEFSTQILVAEGGALAVREDDFVTRLAGSGWVWWFYLYKALIPAELIFVYPRWVIDAAAPLAWVPLLGVGAAYGAAWWTRRGWGRPVLLGLVYFGLMLSPVLGFFDIYYMRFSYVADHYQYLALVGIVALVVSGLGTLLWRDDRLPKPLLLGAAACAIAYCAIASALLSTSYRNAEVLWRDTLAKNPDAFLAHYNLAHQLHAEGRLAEAEHHYRERLRIDPSHVEAVNNLGKVLQDQGRLLEAMGYFRRAIEVDPAYFEAHNNLAVLLEQRGEIEAAISHFRAALEIAPDSAPVLYNLGLLFERLRRYDEAITQYRRALQAAPDADYARTGLARIHAVTAGDAAAH